MSNTAKKVLNTIGSIERQNLLLTDPSSFGGALSVGSVLDGLSNGIATGFGPDETIYAETIAATLAKTRLVAASVGADLATPVAYWFDKHSLRLRVGSTTAAAIPATSGIKSYITENAYARGVLRLGLADVAAAANLLLDQGGLQPITTTKDFEAHFHVCNITNGDIPAAAGFADIGVIGGAADVDPTAVINAAGFIFKIGGGQIKLYSISTTATLIGTAMLPSNKDFVLSVIYDSKRRTLFGGIDGKGIGSTSSYTLPAAVTTLEVGARVCHHAAYVVATHSPLGIDLDGLIVNQYVHN